MKVILQSLTLTNFMGEKSRTTTFNEDVTTISGGNGLGKTRHFNAFTWLLFGKDIFDRKDYEVRTRVNGDVLHKVECSVAATLVVGDEVITIKRESVEEWVKPRGKSEEVFKGNHNECWWNDAPVKVGEFDKRIAAILDTPIFKMLTNPLFFANMAWKNQRAELFKLAGTITDAQLAQEKPEYADLVEALTNKSLSDFKAEIGAKIKKLKAKKEEVNPRIDQTQKMMPETLDFKTIETEIADIDRKIADIDRVLTDNAARVRAQYEAEAAKTRHIADLKNQRDGLVRDAQNKAREDAANANSRRREFVSSLASKQRELSAVQRSINSLVDLSNKYGKDITRQEQDLDTMRGTWSAIEKEVYSGDDVCFHCHQPLPEEMQQANRKAFNTDKVKRQANIEADAANLGNRIEAARQAQADTDAQINEARKEEEVLLAEIKAIEETVATMVEVTPAAVVPDDVPGVADLNHQIEEAQAACATETTDGIDDAYNKARKSDLVAQRDILKGQLATRDEITKAQKMIADLEEYGRELAQQIADLEKQEFTLANFTKCKIEECESRINRLFKHVTFRLFDYTIDGNEYETCYPLVNGVPFGAANTAGQVNAGLDIINALCRYYGINAPIFIDGRESVNELIATDSQIINLVVTKENELTIK